MSTSTPLQVFARRGGALLPARSQISRQVCRASYASYSSTIASRSRRTCQATTAVSIPRHALRAFTTTHARYLASVEERFDPNSVERESDEVDVCIIGGGIYTYYYIQISIVPETFLSGLRLTFRDLL